jgi:dihydropteroate synthase
MGILNVTPDSFSDGGLFDDPDAALTQARAMEAQGADLLDLGGESTRPGARELPPEEEAARVLPVLRALSSGPLPLSIDTRKAAVARAALDAGAALVNDVSPLAFDPPWRPSRRRARGVCLMHAQGRPENHAGRPPATATSSSTSTTTWRSAWPSPSPRASPARGSWWTPASDSERL